MLPSGEKEKSGEHLILHNTSRLDSGTYICGASNGVESPVDAKIKLKVICECYIPILEFLMYFRLVLSKVFISEISFHKKNVLKIMQIYKLTALLSKKILVALFTATNSYGNANDSISIVHKL